MREKKCQATLDRIKFYVNLAIKYGEIKYIHVIGCLMLAAAVIVETHQIIICTKTDIIDWKWNGIEDGGNGLKLVTFNINTNGTACRKYQQIDKSIIEKKKKPQYL